MEISALAAAGDADADAGGAGVTKRLFPLSYFGHTCALFWIRLLARKKCKALNPFEYTTESLRHLKYARLSSFLVVSQ